MLTFWCFIEFCLKKILINHEIALQLQFQLVDGNVENAFSISAYQFTNEFRAVITTAGKVDRETTSLYRLMVRRLSSLLFS